MESVGPATLIGIAIGVAWGAGCSIALFYSIYLGGYQRGIEDSLSPVKPKRFDEAMQRFYARNA
jgi:hypothetical protein